MNEQLILAGDIGGTKTLLTMAKVKGHCVDTLLEMRFPSGEFTDLESMVDSFRREHGLPMPAAACFGVAGPVEGDFKHQRARLTNLPWRLDSETLSKQLSGVPVRLINDFQAVGYGIAALTEGQLVTLQSGSRQPDSPKLVIGAGTGLGVALLVPSGDHDECLPTEGGHQHFAPADRQQDRLLDFMRKEFGRVSWERVVSGPGLVNIYRFLLNQSGMREENDKFLFLDDPAAAIAAAADAGNELADLSMNLFIELYGTVAGDMALGCLANGGVYVAGGIAPRILERMKTGPFIDAFQHKGRMTRLARNMPVEVVNEPRTGLLGSALVAGRLAVENAS